MTPEELGWELNAAQQQAATRALSAALEFTELSRDEIVAGYVAIGGNHPQRVGGYLHGELTPSSYEYNVLAQVFNDAFVDHGQDHPVPYAEQLPTEGPPG